MRFISHDSCMFTSFHYLVLFHSYIWAEDNERLNVRAMKDKMSTLNTYFLEFFIQNLIFVKSWMKRQIGHKTNCCIMSIAVWSFVGTSCSKGLRGLKVIKLLIRRSFETSLAYRTSHREYRNNPCRCFQAIFVKGTHEACSQKAFTLKIFLFIIRTLGNYSSLLKF